jgi:hypothetical protein
MRQGAGRLHPGQAEIGVSSYLARWHLAFAARQGGPGPLVELWFDRGAARPLCERVRLPQRLDAGALRVAALYLAALINNKLCVWGARRVSLVSDEANLGKELLRRVSNLLLYRTESFSDLALLFILALIEQCHGERLVLDTDRDQAARLSALMVDVQAAPGVAPPSPGRHTVVAVNIGQHKTGWGLVNLDGMHGYGLSRTGRQETWPEAGSHCLPQLADALLAAVGQSLGQLPPEAEAVCLSLANPVVGGRARGVSPVGMCATCDPEAAADLDQALRRAAAKRFPGLPFFLVNDAAAQGLFTSRYGEAVLAPAGPGAATRLLSVRFGACPSVSYIDASGRNLDRLNEYPWLVTTVQANSHGEALFATISRYLSFYGFGAIAGELGLLDKYGLEQDAAAGFFHGLYTEGNEDQWRDALKIYRILGAHIAMLAYEIQRDTPVFQVALLGSRANHLDAAVFGPIWDGFAGFIDRHGLPFTELEFNLVEDVSTEAGLVGAAVAYADTGRTCVSGQVGPGIT